MVGVQVRGLKNCKQKGSRQGEKESKKGETLLKEGSFSPLHRFLVFFPGIGFVHLCWRGTMWLSEHVGA